MGFQQIYGEVLNHILCHTYIQVYIDMLQEYLCYKYILDMLHYIFIIYIVLYVCCAAQNNKGFHILVYSLL